jgi:protein involved in polysaccharide export with SLBB domain
MAYDYVSEAEISRLKDRGSVEELIKVKLSENVVLQRGDRIRVLFEENNKLDFKVLVLGEVNRPGKIYIKKEGTTLAEAIANTGGFRSGADLNRAEILRNYSPVEILKKQKMLQEFSDDQNQNLTPEFQLKIKQISDEYSMARTSNLTIEDSTAFNIDNKLRVLNSEQLVDFNGLRNNSPDVTNFLLRDGDVILVPLKFNYVYVFGQVEKVGYVKHEEGKDYKYYIEKSGGISEEAKDLDEVAIVKGKSRKWVVENKETTSIDPGDFIYVPKTIRRPFQYYLENFGSIASIIGSIATIILLVIQSGK